MILLIFSLILLIPLLTVLLVRRVSVSRRRKKLQRCTVRAEGIVERFDSRGLHSPTLITVAYTAGTQTYRVRESLKYRSEAIRLGKLPIGQRKLPVLGKLRPGDRLTVRYCPENPALALIEGNEGLCNC